MKNLALTSTFCALLNRGSRARRSAVGAAVNYTLERLECRLLLAGDTWIASGGGDWDTASNWSTGKVPGLADDAVINLPASDTITHSTNAADSVKSITSTAALTLSNGSLTVETSVAASVFTLEGGTLIDASLSSGTVLSVVGDNGPGTLSGVTVAAGSTVNVPATVSVTAGLTVNGTLNLGPTTNQFGHLNFDGTQTLGGNGSVVFGSSESNGISETGSSGSVLTLGSALTISGGSGFITASSGDSIANDATITTSSGAFTLGNSFGTAGSLSNYGAISASGGASLTIYNLQNETGQTISITGGSTLYLGGTWANAGTISNTNSTVDFAGTFTVVSIGTFNTSGGTVDIVGTLDNSGTTLALSATTGPWNLSGGTIVGGTISDTAGAIFSLVDGGNGPGTLSGVTIAAGSTVNLFTTVSVTAGLTVNGTLNLGPTTNQFGHLEFDGTQTLGGSGSVVFGSSLANAAQENTDNGSTAATLTIGSGLTISGGNGYIDCGNSGDSIVNDGTITDANGGTLGLNDLTIELGQATTGSFTNDGTIQTLSAGALRIGGIDTSLGTMLGAAGFIYFDGTLNNSGNTLQLNSSTGILYLEAGTISGGTIATAGSGYLDIYNDDGTTATLSGVTDTGTIDIAPAVTGDTASAAFTGGLTLSGGQLDLAATSDALFSGTQTISGTGSVNLAAGTSLVAGSSATVLTVGSGVTIGGQGTVGSTSATISNSGILEATGGNTLTVQGLANYSSGTLTGGSYEAVGTNSILRLVGDSITTDGGTLVEDGKATHIYSNAGTTDALTGMNEVTAAGALSLFHGASETTNANLDAEGNVDIDPTSSLNVGGNYTVGAATTLDGSLTASTVTVSSTGVLTGAGSITGNLVNDGQVTPGDGTTTPGAISVSGNFTQGSGGAVTIYIGGAIPTSGYCQLNVAGTATLDGSLTADTVNGFGPTKGQTFAIVNYASETGDFAAVHGLKSGYQTLFLENTNPTDVDLDAAQDAVDLSLEAMTFPSSAISGQNITLNFTVQNLNSTAADGDWQDSFFISPDATFDTNALLLGRVSHTGGIAANGSYTGSLAAVVPNLADGNYHIIAELDSKQQVADSDRANTIVVSGNPIEISVPTLAADASVSGSISAGQDIYYQVTTSPGQSLSFTLTLTSGNQAQLFIGAPALPTQSQYAQTGNASNAVQTLTAADLSGGSYYIYIHGLAGAPENNTFSLASQVDGLAITSFTPNFYVSTSGAVQMQINGTGFTPATTVSLQQGSSTPLAPTAESLSNGTITATFDLSGEAAGNYDVIAQDGASTATASEQFQVSSVQVDTDYAAQIVGTTASQISIGSPIFLEVELIPSSTDYIFVPLIDVAPTNAGLISGQQYEDQVGEVLSPGELVSNGVGGTNYPGEYYVFQPAPVGDGVVSNFSISALYPDQKPNGYASAETALMPSGVSQTAWDAVYQNFLASVGKTDADFYYQLTADAQALTANGDPDATANSLVSFEMARANDLPDLLPLPSTPDFSDPSDPLPLTFTRTYGQGITGHYSSGPFGYGWDDNFDIHETTATNDTVMIYDDGTVQTFLKLANGSYRAEDSANTSTLSDVDGALELTDSSNKTIVFNSNGTLNYIKDANGNEIQATYNASSQLASLNDTSGQSLAFAYNSNGNIEEIDTATGQRTVYAYDSSGTHLLSVSSPQGTTSYTYSLPTTGPTANEITSITQPSGASTYFTYDAQGRLSGQAGTNDSAPLTYLYGAASYSITNADKSTTTYGFNSDMHVSTVTDPSSNQTAIAYDGADLASVALPDEPATQFNYTVLNQLESIVDPMGNAQTFSYTDGDLTSSVDPLGLTTQFAYDANHNRKTVTYPDGTTLTLTYYPSGLIHTTKNRAGNVTTYTYNGLGQITRSQSPSETDTYTYYSDGNLQTATNANGTITLDYNTSNEITSIAEPGGYTLQYAYNSLGQRTQLVQPGITENYSYNSNGQLSQITNAANQIIAAYTYDTAGRLETQTNENGTWSTYAYDPDGRTQSIYNYAPSGAISSFYEYTYTPQGWTNTQTTEAGTTSYGYNADGQLTVVVAPEGTITTYTYDKDGDRISQSVNGVNTTYVVKPGTQEYSSIGGVLQQYDTNGDLTSGTGPLGDTTNTYDAEGRILTSTTVQGTTDYAYDALGDLISTTTNGQTTQNVVDPLDNQQIVAQYNGSGTFLAGYTEGSGLTSTYNASGDQSFYSYDADGDVSQLTDSSGNVADSYSYSAFGDITTQTSSVSNTFTTDGRDGSIDSNGLTVTDNGQSYNPSTGNFTQPDPGNVFGAGNQYSANGSNPLPGTLYGGPNGSTTYGAGLAVGGAASLNLVDNDDGRAFLQVGFGVGFGAFGVAGTRGGSAEDNQLTLQSALGLGCLALQQSHELFVPASLDGKPIRDPNGNSVGLQNPSVGASYTLNLTFQLPSGFAKLLGLSVKQVGPADPNYISGPTGAGGQEYVPANSLLNYTIGFENDPDADAPAQVVTITQQLSPNADWSTFQFANFAFGGNSYAVPARHQSYSTLIDLTSTLGIDVDVNANFDPTTGLATWTFTSIDPATLDVPADPTVGFLPPDSDSPDGEGSVSYTVQAKSGLATGATIAADASIVFDENAAIDTGNYVNTIDADAPTSSVATLPAYSVGSFTLNWSGSDAGSGIANYTIYESEDGGAYAPLLSDTTETSTTFTGTLGHTYSFYSVATDNVGNVQAAPTSAQATTLIVNQSSISGLSGAINQSYGTSSLMLSGTISAGSIYPATTETVAVTLNGVTVQAPISAQGNFTATLDTSELPISTTPYQVTYSYAGDSNLSPVTDNTTTTVSVYSSLPAWISPTSVATWNPTSHILNVTGAATIIADPGTDEPIVEAGSASAVLTIDPTSGTDIHLGGLSLTGGASAVVTSLGSQRSETNYHLLVIGTPGASVAPMYTIDSTSTLDLADNDMAILYGSGTSPLSTVQVELKQAYDKDLWDKPGLTSSIAKTMPSVTALGFGEASTLGFTTFDGLTLGGNAVVVKYTLVGDANLDGTVNLADYNKMLSNFNATSGATWTGGSFDYSGSVGLADYNDVIHNFNQTLANVLPSTGSPSLTTTAAPAVAKVATAAAVKHKSFGTGLA